MAPSVELARQQWADGHRRLHEERTTDPRRHRVLLGLVEALTEQLRRRVGGVYTLGELAAVYQDADRWLRDTLADVAPPQDASVDATLAADAAFYLYARGAQDYSP